MKTIFTYGDKVEIKDDWRYWKKGDKAKVIGTQSQHGDVGVFVELQAFENHKAEKDCSLLYAYQVQLLNQGEGSQWSVANTLNQGIEPLPPKKKEDVLNQPIECYVICDEPQNESSKIDTHFYLNSLAGETIGLVKKTTLSPAVKDDWISVEDTLPDENQKVLVCKRTGHISIATYFPIDQFNREKMFVCIGGAYYDLTWIRYWMLLPTPPQTNPDQSKQ
jgi:hypothetical protein